MAARVCRACFASVVVAPDEVDLGRCAGKPLPLFDAFVHGHSVSDGAGETVEVRGGAVVEVSEGRRPVGTPGKTLIGFGALLAAGLIVAVIVACAAARAEGVRVRRTAELLKRLAPFIRDRRCVVMPNDHSFTVVPRAGSGAPEDWARVERDWEESYPSFIAHNLQDAWHRPLIYRRPGPVHKRGWDLWSCGPNGMDEQGSGDDLLVGEDLAPIASRT
jgi:hypothetical protein